MTALIDNPLLGNDKLPPFSRIKPEHIEPAIDFILDDNRKKISDVTAADQVSWETSIAPLEELEDRLNRAWSPVGHLHSVADNEQLRTAYNQCLEKLSDYATDLGQNRDLFNIFKKIEQCEEYKNYTSAQKKIVELALRDFHLSGIDLPEQERAKYKSIQQQLSKLQTRFEENLLDATHAWKKHITDQSLLAGLPESVLSLAAQTAKQEGASGWLFTLDFPSYMPVMQYADNSQLREEMYRAYVTRASEFGSQPERWDNSQIMHEILKLRYQSAQLLGFNNFAEYSLTRKMARTTDQVMEFLLDLGRRSKPHAMKEYDELTTFAQEKFTVNTLEAWDVAYYAEKLRQHKFNLSQEELRPYFPVAKVLNGLFEIVHRLYGLEINERAGVDIWHADVKFFEIHDKAGDLRGSFYLDLYARPHKRGGAWMDECRVRKKSTSDIQNPVAYLTCNFTPPVGDQPSLLTHDEVTTLFHEFGHGLHHMLTLVDVPGVAGINGVPWDAVELPSQFMENWCWERDSLNLVGKHYQSDENIPDDVFDRLLASKTFQSGMHMVRQLEFAIFDFRLHLEYSESSPVDIQNLIEEVRNTVAVVIPPTFNRFQHSFSHIFAGGYAAGYYSYKWAELLSADAFSKFEENGIFDAATGQAFLHSILEQGGSREPMELFIEFRGREPRIDALLRHSGIEA